MKIKSIPSSKLRMVDNDKPISLMIDSKHALEETVIDYIIHNLSANSHHNSRKIKIRHYQPIRVKVQLNRQIYSFVFELPQLLQKYTTRSKQIENGTVQHLTRDIINFIEQLEDQTITPSIQLQAEANNDKILSILIDKHLQQKRRQNLQGEYNQIKNLLSNKYKKVSFKVGEQKNQSFSFQEQNSQRVSRSTLNALMERQESGKKHLQVPNKSKLKILVQSCNVFDFPDKIESLKKQKLISEFCVSKESSYIQARQQVKKHYPCASTNTLTIETIQQLQDWINDISLSEYLFKSKYEPKNQKLNKHKTDSQSSSSQGQL